MKYISLTGDNMRYIVAVGSSVSKTYLNAGLEEIAQSGAMEFHKTSKIYCNKSVSTVRNYLFFNCAVAISSPLQPHGLYRELKAIEHRLGRIRSYRNATRTLDLDIIMSFPFSYKNDCLTIPHVSLGERSFFVYCAIEVIQSVGWEVPFSLYSARAKLGAGALLCAV